LVIFWTMELKKLILKNFRSHKKFEATFEAGISAIVGENGTGKSSLVEAIIFLFTGDGYGSKADMLALGEASGYVLGHLMIDGKEAVLERHLDCSKVVLKYDGVIYKKASEVAELWESLFQIDKNIFKNIVVARQGDIPLLFSGEPAVREKIFQKIFMVPNTTKIRDTIWNKYIKTAPPEYPVADLESLSERLIAAEQELLSVQLELEKIPNNLDENKASKISRQTYLNSCAASENERINITNVIATAELEVTEAEQNISKISSKLQGINISEITSFLDVQKANKPHYLKRTQLENTLKGLLSSRVLFSEEQAQLLTQKESDEQEIRVKLGVAQQELINHKKQLQEYASKGLTGQSSCPTCGAPLADLTQYLEHLNSKIFEVEQNITQQAKRKQELEIDTTTLRKQKDNAKLIETRIQELEASIEALKDVNYDEGTCAVYDEVVQQYKRLSDEKDQSSDKLAKTTQRVFDLHMKLSLLPRYDGAKGSIAEELVEVSKQLELLTQTAALKLELLQRSTKAETLREVLQREKKQAVEHKLLNARRKTYVDLLHDVYELMATGQFPRKLIQTYSDTVSEYLDENLRKFNFPYSAKVNESFGITVCDFKNRELPSVSGGQEIMIGIALRLALHNLFGAAFPMMIFDEGSVHLSSESRKSYFDIVRQLKSSSAFKQIIMIDHDEELASVVDHTINLNKQ
jgi:exonuclease SbcC